MFDHTDTASTHYALRLSGSPSETNGLARSIAVMPGDKVRASVYAKYVDPSQGNITTALQDLLTSIAAGTASSGTVIDGPSYGGSGAGNNPYALLLDKSGEAGDAPKAYLNYLVFNKNFELIVSKSGYQRMSTAAREDGLLAPQGVAHQLLQSYDIPITEPGYVYIYLSNEEPGKEVYFDDFTVEHEKSPIVQSQDYYPFGLTFNSYQRENSTENRFLYNQGSGEKTFRTERVYDLGLNVDQSKYRTYDYTAGRWWQVDPMADEGDLGSLTPYNYSYNNPVRYNDPEGDCPLCAAVGAAVGAVVGGGIEAGMQLYEHGEVNDWGAVGGAALQGGITGGVAGLTGGASLLVTTTASVGANVAGGALNNAIQGKEITIGTIAKDAAIGAGGAVLGKVAGAAINKLSPATKGQIGEVATQVKYAMKGYVRVDKAAVETGAKTATGRVQRAQYDHAMKNVITGKKLTVESKFNSAKLTANQKAAAGNVKTEGGLIVDRTTGNQVGSTGAGVATGSTSSQIKKVD